MDRELIEKAGAIVAGNAAHGAKEGAEPYCALALIDEDGTPTASAVTPARAEGIAWIAFCTGLQSNKVKRIEKCDRAGVLFAGANHNVSLTGRIEVVTDGAVKREMWYDGLKHHFTGPDDPNYCVLKFITERYNLLIDWREARGTYED